MIKMDVADYPSIVPPMTPSHRRRIQKSSVNGKANAIRYPRPIQTKVIIAPSGPSEVSPNVGSPGGNALSPGSKGATGAQGERRSSISDLLPAAAIPVLAFATIMTAFGQSAILREILQHGNLLSFMSLVLLILPIMTAAIAYSKSLRLPDRTSRNAAWITLFMGAALALAIPINYSIVEFGILMAVAVRLFTTRTILRQICGIVILATSILATAVLVRTESNPNRAVKADWLYQVVIGRVLDGLTTVNIVEYGRQRSVRLVGTTDDFVVAVSTDYPPTLRYLPAEILATAQPCQERLSHNQRSLFAIIATRVTGEEAGSSVPKCTKEKLS